MKPQTQSFTDNVLAQALNVPLYRTAWYIPKYKEATKAAWRITSCPFHLAHGYTTGVWGISSMPLLLRRQPGTEEAWETWMSLTPHEIESQELACLYGTGHCVIMGLGMGWIAINMALNPEIQKVTVIEHDPEVITLITNSGAFSGLSLESIGKIHIIEADALTWVPQEKVDFLYADIWQGIDEPNTIEQMQQMQANIKADSVYFWGQEIKISHSLGEHFPHYKDQPAEILQQALSEVFNLPLLVPEQDYVDLVEDVIALRKGRGLIA